MGRSQAAWYDPLGRIQQSPRHPCPIKGLVVQSIKTPSQNGRYVNPLELLATRGPEPDPCVQVVERVARLGQEQEEVELVQVEEDNDDEPTAFERIGLQSDGVDDDIERVRALVFRRRCRTKPFFQTFDRLRTGKCAKFEFCRGLANVIFPNAFNDPEMPIDAEAIAEHFVDPEDKKHEPRAVNYVRFCEIVDEVFNIYNLESNPEIEVPEPGATVLDAGGYTARTVRDETSVWQLLRKVALLTETRGINLHTCFNTRARPYVDVRVGRIEPADFMHSFPLAQSTSTVTAAVTQEEMHLLVERYSDDNGFVRLTPFENDVKALLAQKKDPENWQNEFLPVRPFANGTKGLSCRDSPFFPLQPSHAKQRPQSARQCARIPPPDMSEQSTPMNSSRPHSATTFIPRNPKMPARPKQRPQSAQFSGRPQSARQIPPPPEVMPKLIKAAFERRLRLHDIFQQSDRFRHGMLTHCQMCTALTCLGISFSAKEYNDLFEKFSYGSEFFHYKDCCAVVDEAIVNTKGPFPVGGNGAAAARSIMINGSIQTSNIIDEDEQALLVQMETVIARRSVDRGVDIWQVLDDFSHAKWAKPGHVTDGQFVRAMKTLDLELSDKELNTLLEKYCDTEYSNEFNYMDFCRNVDRHMGTMDKLRSRFDLGEDAPDLCEMQGHAHLSNGPIWANPYFDERGKVRPQGSRPNSAYLRRPPQYASSTPSAGFRRGQRPRSAMSSSLKFCL